MRQLAAAEGSILARISGLIFWTISLILVLTTLGVLASMAALAMERSRDVGLMKALGGSVERIMHLFLAEAYSKLGQEEKARRERAEADRLGAAEKP